MSSRDSSDVTLGKVVSTGLRRDDGHCLQSPLVKGFLEFRKGEPLAQTFLFQKSVILTDPPEVACQSGSPNRRGAEGR